MASVAAECLVIDNNNVMPQLGLGTWKIKDEAEMRTAVEAAIESGYRHFDTAQEYGNEGLLGKCLEEAGIVRESLFITTKIWWSNYGRRRTKDSLDASLDMLGVKSIGLALLHVPVFPVLDRKAWQALEEMKDEGRVRSIGVSNFTIPHLQALIARTGIKPSVNQVEMHVFQQQPEMLAYCKDNDIKIAAYSPLAHGKFMGSKIVAEVARRHSKTPAQIMLRWCVEKGAVVLPKSTKPERIAENAGIFDFSLSEEDMAFLSVAHCSKYTNHPRLLGLSRVSAPYVARL